MISIEHATDPRPFRDVWIEEWESVRGTATCNWCGREATHIVGRTSNLSDHDYADPSCRRHAVSWGLYSIIARRALSSLPEWAGL